MKHMNNLKFIEATNESHPRVAGVAYGGGKISLGGWDYPIVVDLSGVTIPESVPLLANHDNRTASRIGMVSAMVNDNALEIAGEIISESPEAANIVAQAKAGAHWQLSIGADVKAYELIKSGSKIINGVAHQAPFYHVSQSVLREVSVVAVGADASTTMKIAASFNFFMNDNLIEKNQATENNGEVEAAIKAERSRVTAIQKVCDGEFPEIEREAIQAGWTSEMTTTKVLNAMRAKRPQASVHISVKSQPEGVDLCKALEAAMCLRCGISADSLEKSYGPRVVETGMADRNMPMKTLLVECMRMDGIPYGRGFDNDTIRAAFSSVSLPGILSNVANKKLLESYKAQPITATKLCSIGDLNDFKEAERFRLTDVGDLLPVAPDGEIKEGGLIEDSAKNQLDTYGKKFCLTRKMIINDDLGAFMKVPVAMGNRAARLIDQLFFKRLLGNPTQSDGKALFHANHKNLLTGTTSALSHSSLAKAIQLFLDQVDADDQPISVEPRYLLVPTALKHTAIELTRGATLVMSGGSDSTIRPALNVLVDENLEVVSSPYLANGTYSGHSDGAWYLFGHPGQVDTFEIGFLNGKRTPTVEQGETDFNTLGMWFRVYFDIGVREQDHRGMVKANGAA
jgi:phage head maturation protease